MLCTSVLTVLCCTTPSCAALCCTHHHVVWCAVQTRFEVVVVHEEEEKCRDAMYNMAAGPSVVMAVHPSGLNVSKKRNNTLITSRYFTRNG